MLKRSLSGFLLGISLTAFLILNPFRATATCLDECPLLDVVNCGLQGYVCIRSGCTETVVNGQVVALVCTYQCPPEAKCVPGLGE